MSAIVWLSGAIVLLSKGASLFAEAVALNPDQPGSWLAIAAGVLIGAAKAQFLFGRFCRRNLDRIAALQDPQLTQAFRPQFYAFLATMVLLGAFLSRLANGNYVALMALVTLDISLAVALLGSLRSFFVGTDGRNTGPTDIGRR